MGTNVVFGRAGQIKMRVEPLFHHVGRYPMGKMTQRINAKFQIFSLGKIAHGGIAIVEPVAPARHFLQPRRGYKCVAAFFARQQNTALFIRLTN